MHLLLNILILYIYIYPSTSYSSTYMYYYPECYGASHIRQFHLSGSGLVPFMTDNWGSTVVVNLTLTTEARLVHTYTASIYLVLLSIDRDCLRTWDDSGSL